LPAIRYALVSIRFSEAIKLTMQAKAAKAQIPLVRFVVDLRSIRCETIPQQIEQVEFRVRLKMHDQKVKD